MRLIQMSISGSVLILVILTVRILWLDKLPKRTFPVLWNITLLRLLIPFSVPYVYSVYSFLETGRRQISGTARTAEGAMAGAAPLAWDLPEYPVTAAFEENPLPLPGESLEWLFPLIWALGCSLCAAFFVVVYLLSLRRFREALPVEDQQIRQWLRQHGTRRSISVRQTDRIAAPLTYGILHPVILLPGKALWKDSRELAYVLQHEYVHICRLDAVRKLLAAAALCVHWFNPFVWIMIGMMNRDIELACDEDVLQRFGMEARTGYAMALIGMEEKKSRLLPIFNGFSKNAIEERINLIMKYRKIKSAAVAAAFLLVLLITLGFATSAKKAQATESQSSASAQSGESLQSKSSNRESEDAGTDAPHPENLESEKQILTSSVNGNIEYEDQEQQVIDGSAANTALTGSNAVAGNRADENGSAANSQATPYILSYMSEGLPQEEPADLYLGSGYGILIPKEGWQMYAPDAWHRADNDLVQFWVTDYGRNTLEQVSETLASEGYTQTEDASVLQKETDGRLFFVRPVQEGARVMNVTWTYPTEPEYMEGFGTCLNIIAMNFRVLPEETNADPSEDARQAEQLALAFWESWLAADEAGMKTCLSAGYKDRIEAFPAGAEGYNAKEAEIRQVKGLDFEQMALGDSREIWIEFLPSAQSDSLEYLTLELVKEQDGPKIYSYGLEK